MVWEGCTAAAGHGWHMLVLGPARVSTRKRNGGGFFMCRNLCSSSEAGGGSEAASAEQRTGAVMVSDKHVM